MNHRYDHWDILTPTNSHSCCFAGASGHRRERFALWWVRCEPTAQRAQRALVHAPEPHRRGASPSPRWQRHLWPNTDHGLPGAEFQQWWDWIKTLYVFWSSVAGLDWSCTSSIRSWVSYFAFSFQHFFFLLLIIWFRIKHVFFCFDLLYILKFALVSFLIICSIVFFYILHFLSVCTRPL